MDRRSFLLTSLAAAATGCHSAAPAGAPGALGAGAGRRAAIRFGQAAITWGGNDLQAIDDIAAAGYPGIQLRASAVQRWGARPDELKALLADRGLTLVALSSGLVRLDPSHTTEDLALHLRHARFLREVGGLYLQVFDERPRGRPPETEDYRRSGRLLTELGRRIADLGVSLGYHNHMGNLGQAPDEVARVLEASDPRWVHLLLDTAHWAQAGGDPAGAVREHADRLLFLHVKDLVSPVPGGDPRSYRFVELGEGRLDFAAFFRALDDVGFADWAIVELDSVPPGRDPLAAARHARAYIEHTLGYRVTPDDRPGRSINHA